MKILVISHSAIQPTYQRKFEEVSRYCDVQLRVLVPDTWYENYQTLHFSGCSTSLDLSFHAGNVAFPGYGSRFFFTKGIVKHFREFRPDIIHIEEEPWSLCVFQAIILRRIFCPQSKLIFRTSLSIPGKLKFSLLARLIERITFKESDYAFILSKRAGEILTRKGYRKRMGVSPNGVDTQVFRKMDVSMLKSQLGLAEADFVIGYVGRLMRMKGLDTLLKAFSMLVGDMGESKICTTAFFDQNFFVKKFILLIVGSGEYRDEMLSVASRLGINERMLIVDAVPAEEVPGYINCMDVLVLPSITTPGWVEFFGRVLIEAMVCEVPVIGSSSGEIPNVVGDVGLIFREGEENDLKAKLAMLIEDPTLRRSLAMAGFQRATSLFTWESIAKATCEAYQSITSWKKRY